MSEALQALVDSMSVRFKTARVDKMSLNIRIQWNAGTACVSECVLKTLACRGLRVGPSKACTGGKIEVAIGNSSWEQQKAMTARDVTGFYAFFCAMKSGNFVRDSTFWGDFLPELHRKPPPERRKRVHWRKFKTSSRDGAPNCRFLSLVIVKRVLNFAVPKFVMTFRERLGKCAAKLAARL